MATSVQTSVSTNAAVGQAGMEYDIGENDIVSKTATESFPFGVYVSFNDEACELSDSAAEVNELLGGIALKDPSKASTAGYVTGDQVRVLKKGRAWVTVESTVTAGSAAYVRHTASGTNTQKGAFAATGDTATCAVPPNTVFYKAAVTGDLAIVEVNLPGSASATS